MRITQADRDEGEEQAVNEEPSGPVASGDDEEASVPRRSIRHNVSILFVTQLATWSISLVLLVALPRFLGSTGIGQLRLVSSVWMVAASFVALGTHMLVMLDVAKGQRAGAQIVPAVALARSLAFLIATAVIAGFVSVADYDDDVRLLFVIVGVSTFVNNIGSIAASAIQGFENFTMTSVASIVEKLSSTIMIMAALMLGGGVHVVAAIGVVAALIHLVLLYNSLGKIVRIPFRTSLRAATTAARRGLPYLFGAVVMVAYHELDTVIMSLLVPTEQIGWYAAAARLTATSLFIPTIVMSALFPAFARIHQYDAEHARRMIGDGFRGLLLLALPIGAGLAIISTPLALLLFGEEFRQSGPVLAVLAISLGLMFLTILIGNYAVATGGERFYFSLIFIGFLASIPLDLVLIPLTNRWFENGAIGGALAYIVTEGFILAVAIRRFAPEIVSRSTAVRLIKCAIAAAAMSAVVWPLRWVFPIVPILAGAAVYAVIVAALSTLSVEERQGVRSTLVAVRSRIRS